MRHRESLRRQAGFSLIELIVVITIILVVSAIAVPTLINTVADVRLRSSASTLQGQLQLLRMRAVNDNKPYKLKMATQGGTLMAYLDLDGGDDYDTTEPAVGLAKDVSVATSGAPTMPSTTLNTAGWINPATAATALWFNARGIPCDGVGACNAPKGYIYFLSQSRNVGTTAWAAVSVTPAGRIKVWRWTGSAWQ